jgi:hypothetical protein
MNDYYPAETVVLLKRKIITDKRRDERIKKESQKPKEEPIEEVYWGDMGI